MKLRIMVSMNDAITTPNPIIHVPSRLRIMSQLYVVESMDYLSLKNLTKLTWGNLSSHLSKLESVNYIYIEKDHQGKKPRTTLKITEEGKKAFDEYRDTMKQLMG